MSADLPRFARRSAALSPSATLAAAAGAARLRAEGVEILSLTAGEPDFRPPACAEEAAIAAIHAGRGRYTAAAGLPELREAVADTLIREAGLAYPASQVVVSNGAKIALAQAILVLVERGDNVIVPSPCWTSYEEMIKLAEAEPRLVPNGADGLPQLADLEAARDERTAAILLNTPCNPTGVVYPRECVTEIGRWALKHGIRVTSDEIYAGLVYGDATHVSPLAAVPELQDSSVWIGGMSKAYAMTGWRMGFLAAGAEIAKAVATMQSQLASSSNAISQLASLAALRDGAADREKMRLAFAARRDLVVRRLSEIPGLSFPEPQGAFYAFLDISHWLGLTDPDSKRPINSGDDLAEVLLNQDRLAAVSGSAFAAPHALRLSFAASEETLNLALDRLAARLARLS